MRRHLIGILGLLLLLGILVTWNWGSESAWRVYTKSACWRLGPLLVILWLAFPQFDRMPSWLWFYVGAVLVVAALRPKVLLVLIPIIIVLAIVKPRIGRRE